MRRTVVAGLDVVIENEVGSARQWRDRASGTSGVTVMKYPYGYIDGHVGADGEEVDCYIGPDESAKFVYVVHQLATPDYQRFDEDKAFLQFQDESSARSAYLAHRSDGERAYGGMSAIPLEKFKEKLQRRTGTGKIRHEAGARAFDIVKRSDGWHVVSEDHSKHLGGPYPSRAKAEERLRQVEAHKHSFRPSFVPGRSMVFEGERGPDGQVRTGVWDRFTSTGEKVKEGRLSVFDQRTLTQMAVNWRERGDKLAMCWNHQSAYVEQNGQPAPALAFYDALAVVIGGQVVCCYALDGSLAPSAGFEAAARGDGLYGFRCEVTEKGQELLPNFKFISPMFTDEGRDEQGREVGYVLYDVAATNTPFQAGCEITFSGHGAPSAFDHGGAKMARKLTALSRFVRLEEGADDKAVRAAVLEAKDAELKKAMEEEGYNYEEGAGRLEDMAKALEDAQLEDEGGSEAPHVTMRRLAAKFRRMAQLDEIEGNGGPGQEPLKGQEDKAASVAPKATMDDGDGDEDDKAAKGALQAMAQRLGVALPAKASSRQMMDALQAASVPASQLPTLVDGAVKRALAEQEQKRVAAETQERARALIASLEGYPEENKKALLTFASDPKNFEAALTIAKPFIRAQGESLLFQRMTSGGNPVALSADASRTSAPSNGGRKVYENALATWVVDDEEIAAKVLEYADAKDGPMKMEVDALLSESERDQRDARWIAADRIVRTKKNPELWERTKRAQTFGAF